MEHGEPGKQQLLSEVKGHSPSDGTPPQKDFNSCSIVSNGSCPLRFVGEHLPSHLADAFT